MAEFFMVKYVKVASGEKARLEGLNLVKKFLRSLNQQNCLLYILICFSILLRLYLAPHTAFDGDIATWRDVAYQMVVKGRTFDFYHASIYAYPPMWSWFISLAYLLHPTLNYHDEVFLMLVKLPMIVSDAVIGVLIYLFVGRHLRNMNSGLLAGALWLFNPDAIYIGSMWGMNDSLCIVFIVASLYLLSKEKLLSSAFMLGLAVSTKQYAVLVVPFLALAVLKKYDVKKGLTFLLVPFAVLALVSTPYLIYDREAYISQILYGVSEQQLKIRQKSGTFWYCIKSLLYRSDFYAFFVNLQYPIFFGICAVSLAVFNKVTHKIGDKALNNAVLISTLVFLVFSPVVHAQYYLLFIPFTIIASFYKRLKPLWYAITILPFYSFFSIEIWVDRAEAVLWQMIIWLNNLFSAPICDNLRLIRFVLFFALSALLISSYIGSGRE